MPVEVVNRAMHRRTDQGATGDSRRRAGKSSGPRTPKVRLQILEEMTRDADSIFDLRISVVELGRRHRFAAHEIELIAEVQKRLAALGPEVALPYFSLSDDSPRLF